MGKRVMRSNRRTQRRRGSQLKHKQRKKRSKLLKRTLKRTLKRRNSFRKKNTYKRRRTNMKRGGMLAVDLTTFADSFNKGYYMKYLIRLSKDLTALLNDKEKLKRGVKVKRNTYMGNETFCEIDRVNEEELFVYFKDEGVCKQKWKTPSKLFGRKHGISLTHLMNNYEASILGNENEGYYLDFTRKPGYISFKDG